MSTVGKLSPVPAQLAAPALTLRPLMPADTPRLTWHGGENLRSFYENQSRAHQAQEIYVLVAASEFAGDSDFPIGQAAIHWNGKPTHPQIPDIQSVRVHPDFRGLGIGSQLLQACEQHAAAQGHQQISLSVAMDNPAAQRLYQRLGYCVVGPPYSDVWFYTDAQGKSVRVEETVLDMVKRI